MTWGLAVRQRRPRVEADGLVWQHRPRDSPLRRAYIMPVLARPWQLTRTMRHTETKALMGTVDGAVATFRDVEEPIHPGPPAEGTGGEQRTQPPQEPRKQLLYREEGNVNFSPNSSSDKVFPFYREYMYTFKSPTEADVHFYQPHSETDHMKFFHTLSIELGTGVTSDHVCINDIYSAKVHITSPDAFEMSWQVTGLKRTTKFVAVCANKSVKQ